MKSIDKDRCAMLIDELLRRGMPRTELEPAIEWLLEGYRPPKKSDLQYVKCAICGRPIHKDKQVGDSRGHFPACLACLHEELQADFNGLQSEFNKLRILRGGNGAEDGADIHDTLGPEI